MPLARLLLVLLILLQSGLAAARVHAHVGCDAHTASPHVHTGHLLDLFDAPDHDEDEDGGTDAIDLSAALAPAAPAADMTAPVDLGLVPAVLLTEPSAFRAPAEKPPRPTSGLPRHRAFCVLII
jgi:hypothetical protein